MTSLGPVLDRSRTRPTGPRNLGNVGPGPGPVLDEDRTGPQDDRSSWFSPDPCPSLLWYHGTPPSPPPPLHAEEDAQATPPPPPPPKCALHKRLSNIQLSPEGIFTYSWYDTNTSEHDEQMAARAPQQTCHSSADQAGFFQTRLVRNVGIDPTRPWMMQSEARAGLGTGGWRACRLV